MLYGFKAFKIEETAKDIVRMPRVGTLMRIRTTKARHHSTTVNHFNAGSKELGKIDKDVLRITGESAELESPLIEKPATLEE